MGGEIMVAAVQRLARTTFSVDFPLYVAVRAAASQGRARLSKAWKLALSRAGQDSFWTEL
jgi:hypothetical protein